MAPVSSTSDFVKLTIGVVGFGNFGQFLGKRFASQGHRVIGTSRRDYSDVARSIGCEYVLSNDALMDCNPDVVMLCTSIISLDKVLAAFPLQRLAKTLVVDVLSVKLYPRELLLQVLPEEADILCTHPMFGPVSGAASWNDLPFMYDTVRVAASRKHISDAFVDIYKREECRMVPMTCKEHDTDAASSQFITHTTGRMLDEAQVHDTAINTSGFNSLLGVMDSSTKDSFDLFYGLYKYNPIARRELRKLEDGLRHIRDKLEKAEAEEAQAKSQADNGNRAFPLAAADEVLKSLVEREGSEESDSSHNDMFVNAVAMVFVRRLAAKAKKGSGTSEPLDVGF